MRWTTSLCAAMFLTACGPGAAQGSASAETGASTADSGSAGVTGASEATSGATSGATEASDTAVTDATGDGDSGDGDGSCSGYGNEYGPVVDVTITNSRTEPMYLEVDSCNMRILSQVLHADTGARVGALNGCWTCAGALNGGCVCPGPPCFVAAAIRLEPGASYETSVAATEFVERELSSQCADTDFCGTTCAYATVLNDGDYEVEIAAGAQVNCSGPSCDCVPGAEGWCWIEADGTINAPSDFIGTFAMPNPSSVTIDIL